MSRIRFAFSATLFFLAASLSSAQQLPGSVTGTVVDKSGALVSSARVTLSPANHLPDLETVTDAAGQFSFSNVPPGAFQITIAAKGFATQELTGVVGAGEAANLPQTVLPLARLTIDVRVSENQTALAEEQLKVEEEQRLLGVLPNYDVSYIRPAVPLSPKQKFELAWKTTTDPVSFGITALVAGVEQWQKDYNGYGQGVEGFAKRYGAAYATFFSANMVSGAILPSLLKQDPRYFVKGNGTKLSRASYAIANSVICKGDNGRWQPKFSEVLGGLASSGISDLYLPAKDRNGAADTFENMAIGVGGRAIGNLFQEFVSKKITPKAHH